MKTGDIVKYGNPQPGEDDIRFVLREINGDRVLIELVCNWTIRPIETVMASDVCPCAS